MLHFLFLFCTHVFCRGWFLRIRARPLAVSPIIMLVSSNVMCFGQWNWENPYLDSGVSFFSKPCKTSYSYRAQENNQQICTWPAQLLSFLNCHSLSKPVPEQHYLVLSSNIYAPLYLAAGVSTLLVYDMMAAGVSTLTGPMPGFFIQQSQIIRI